MDYVTQLKNYSKAILKEGDFHEELAPAITGLSDMLFELAQVGSESNDERNHIDTANGSAIGVFWAARCIKEIFRTQRFARGLLAAINDVRKLKKDEPVHVLYAGTGPFATLALPIMASLSPQEVQFTLLEINPKSYEMLQQVIKEFGFDAYVHHSEITDATQWNIGGNHIDVVVSETMNRALIKEPQVSIMLNLASQLPASVIFIPQEIKVSLCQEEGNLNSLKIDDLMVFDKNYIFEVIRRSEKGNWNFEEKILDITLSSTTKLQYQTEIKVYKDNFLGYNDSSLNFPEKLKTKDLSGQKKIKFKYSSLGVPGFKWDILN